MEEPGRQPSTTRRDLLKRAAVGGAVVATVPVILTRTAGASTSVPPTTTTTTTSTTSTTVPLPPVHSCTPARVATLRFRGLAGATGQDVLRFGLGDCNDASNPNRLTVDDTAAFVWGSGTYAFTFSYDGNRTLRLAVTPPRGPAGSWSVPVPESVAVPLGADSLAVVVASAESPSAAAIRLDLTSGPVTGTWSADGSQSIGRYGAPKAAALPMAGAWTIGGSVTVDDHDPAAGGQVDANRVELLVGTCFNPTIA